MSLRLIRHDDFELERIAVENLSPSSFRSRALETVKRWAKRIGQFVTIELLARALYYSGLLFAIARIRQYFGRRRMLVPMYHRIRPPNVAHEPALLAIERGVSAERFEQQLRVLRWFGPLLSLERAFEHLHDRRRGGRSVVAVTFDDGYCDSVAAAVPVLRKHHARATIFPVVRTAGGGRPLWWDELSGILMAGQIDADGLVPCLASLEDVPIETGDRIWIGPSATRSEMASFLCDRLVRLPGSRRERVLDTLGDRLHVAPETPTLRELYANWKQLRQLASEGIEIGSHTIDHVVLTRESMEEVRRQVSEARRILENELGLPVRSFSYPNGHHDATVRTLTRSAGYNLAVTVEHGVNYRDTDPYQLRRVPIGDERPFHLAFKLAFYGLAHRGPARRQVSPEGSG